MCENAITSPRKNARDVLEFIITSNILYQLLERAEKLQQEDDKKLKKIERIHEERVNNERQRREAEQRQQVSTPKRIIKSTLKAVTPRKSSRISNIAK